MKKLGRSLVAATALAAFSLSAATLTLDLEKGWNFVGTPLNINDLSPLDMDAIDIVYEYDQSGWHFFNGLESGLSGLESGDGFWVFSDTAQQMVLEGEEPETTALALAHGWNMSALKGWEAISTKQLFDNACMEYYASYQSGKWKTLYGSDGSMIAPKSGFWARTNSACTVETAPASSSDDVVKIRVVSTPNPSVFPLLLALSDHPDLPVELVPVSGSSTIDSAFAEGRGDALLSMTFVSANKSMSGTVPPLRLKTANLWGGFFEMTRTDDSVTSLADLKGQNLIISGPVGSGKDGGPDIFFQAALRAQGLSLSDFHMFYMPQDEGIPLAVNQTPLDDGDGDVSNDVPAAGILLVDPAASGMVMSAMMGETAFEKGINMQEVFGSYASWDDSELPLGGLSVLQSVDENSSQSAQVAELVSTYQSAADKIMNAKNSMMTLKTIADTISEAFNAAYAEYEIEVPSAVIMAGVQSGDFVYRTDRSVESIQSDLDAFLEFVIESEVGEAFYSQP